MNASNSEKTSGSATPSNSLDIVHKTDKGRNTLDSTLQTTMVEMIFPNQTNHYGTLFGGKALELMDKSAFITASRFARKPMVTACSDRINFVAPAKHGQLVEVIGKIAGTGRSSVTVSVQLFAEDLLSGARQLCAEGHFVLVAVDERNAPVMLNPARS